MFEDVSNITKAIEWDMFQRFVKRNQTSVEWFRRRDVCVKHANENVTQWMTDQVHYRLWHLISKQLVPSTSALTLQVRCGWDNKPQSGYKAFWSPCKLSEICFEDTEQLLQGCNFFDTLSNECIVCQLIWDRTFTWSSTGKDIARDLAHTG